MAMSAVDFVGCCEFALSTLSKVSPTDIRIVTVDESNSCLWPLASLVKPCEPARLVKLPVYTNLTMPSAPQATGDATRSGAAVNSHLPPKRSGFRVIAQNFAQSLCG